VTDDQATPALPPAHAHCWYCGAVVPPAPEHHQVQVPMVQMTSHGPDVAPWWVAVCDEHYEKVQAADEAAIKANEAAARIAKINKTSGRLVVAHGPIRKV
jgi:hypothetical protein